MTTYKLPHKRREQNQQRKLEKYLSQYCGERLMKELLLINNQNITLMGNYLSILYDYLKLEITKAYWDNEDGIIMQQEYEEKNENKIKYFTQEIKKILGRFYILPRIRKIDIKCVVNPRTLKYKKEVDDYEEYVTKFMQYVDIRTYDIKVRKFMKEFYSSFLERK